MLLIVILVRIGSKRFCSRLIKALCQYVDTLCRDSTIDRDTTMQIKNCKLCSVLFKIEGTDTQEILCKRCILDYKKAYVQIHHYVADCEKPAGIGMSFMQQITDAMGLPLILLNVILWKQ